MLLYPADIEKQRNHKRSLRGDQEKIIGKRSLTGFESGFTRYAYFAEYLYPLNEKGKIFGDIRSYRAKSDSHKQRIDITFF